MARFAAVDIGSNSIRMEAAETIPGSPPKLLTSDRQVTRLGASVFRTGKVSAEAIELVCKVLSGMAQQYRKLDVGGVRAVATSAIRDAANQDEFIAKASSAVGTPVEIISGQEESRLIHLGVQNRWPHPTQKVLLVDVGGGSAEIMHSERGHLQQAVSKPLGAVRLTEIFLKSDPPTERELDRMENYVEEKLAAAIRRIGHRRWDRVIATSGTACAVACAVNGISQEKEDKVDRVRVSTAQIQKLYGDLRVRTIEERRKITGIGPRRAEIIIAGMAPLFGLLRDLQLASFYYSAAGAAAYLHDVGHYVSDSRHHKHSYYLVANSDLPGFTNREREFIANLCRYHRKAAPASGHENYELLNGDERRTLTLLIPLLRIADNLDRSHEGRVQTLDCSVNDGQVVLRIGSKADVELEQWAAERGAELFRDVYQREISVTKARS